MARKKILWLVSWYPNKTDRFDGDFLQRHAKAAAIHHDIHVLFVKGVEDDCPTTEEINRCEGLTEQLIYFPKKRGKVGKALNFLKWRKLHFKAISAYQKKCGKPDWVHVQVPWKAGLIALELKKRKGWEYIVTEHWGIYNNQVVDSFSSKPFWVKELWKKIFKEAWQLVSVSSFLGKRINSYASKKPYTIIPNVVDAHLFHYNDDRNPTFTFIHVSNMVSLKNVEGILNAFQKLVESGCTNCQLILIGNRDRQQVETERYSGLIQRQIFFRGEVSYVEVAKEMRQAHCFILNSNIENAPCVISEALCCGLPVIVTKVGGVPEMINNKNGILIKPKSDRELTEAMQKMMADYVSYNKIEIAHKATGLYGYGPVSEKFRDLYNQTQTKKSLH